MKYKVSSVEEKKTSSGKQMFSVVLTDETGVAERINLFDPVKDGDEIEGEIITKGNFRNFKSAIPKKGVPNFSGVVAQKNENIIQAQHRKEESIAKAQDRSAWMWAKTNASTLLAQKGIPADMTVDEISAQVIKLATKIYNGEPLVPFNE